MENFQFFSLTVINVSDFIKNTFQMYMVLFMVLQLNCEHYTIAGSIFKKVCEKTDVLKWGEKLIQLLNHTNIFTVPINLFSAMLQVVSFVSHNI